MTDLFTPFDSRLDQVIDEVALEIAGGSLTKMTLFDAMKRQGEVPDVFSYSALVSACEKGK